MSRKESRPRVVYGANKTPYCDGFFCLDFTSRASSCSRRGRRGFSLCLQFQLRRRKWVDEEKEVFTLVRFARHCPKFLLRRLGRNPEALVASIGLNVVGLLALSRGGRWHFSVLASPPYECFRGKTCFPGMTAAIVTLHCLSFTFSLSHSLPSRICLFM